MTDILARNNVKVFGDGEQTLLMAHGFGCDQNMWRFITPELSKRFRIVLFDYVGSGESDISQYKIDRYKKLEGYADDILEISETLALKKAILVGHSVSSIIGAIASIKRNELFSKLIMVCPSPCFLNLPPDYFGGFEEEDLEELLSLMDKNYIGWADYLAPLVMGGKNPDVLIGELSKSFCSTDPIIAKTFARATFFSDHRSLLKEIKPPTLIFQSRKDSLASPAIGEFIAREIENSQLELIDGEGHCLHMTHPADLIPIISKFSEI